MLRRRSITVEAAKKHLGRRASDRGRVLGDDRDPRLQEIRKEEVVEADQGSPFVQSEVAHCAEGADRDQVLSCEESGWSR